MLTLAIFVKKKLEKALLVLFFFCLTFAIYIAYIYIYIHTFFSRPMVQFQRYWCLNMALIVNWSIAKEQII